MDEAKRLLIPNTCQVPNVLLDEVMPNVSGAGLKVLLAIVRQTYGFGQTSKQISFKRLCALTGLSTPSVASGIRELGDLITINKGPKNSHIQNEYSLNLDVGSGQLLKKFNRLKNLTGKETLLEPVKKLNSLKPTLKPNKNINRPTALPDDFKVTEGMRQWASKNGLPSPDGELEAFRDYHLARGTTWKDWNAAFRTWMRNSVKYGGPKTLDRSYPRIAAKEGKYARLG